MKHCDHCSGTGVYTAYGGPIKITTGGFSGGPVAVSCKYCGGNGWIDEEEMMTVPRKYVKDKYFEQER